MRTLALTLATLGAVALLAQLVPVERTNPPVAAQIAAPTPVHALLRRACYDCHSRETVWPWYSRVAPVSWLTAHDVREGRAELDFSAWAAYPPGRQAKKLRESAEEIGAGEMPPWYYRLVHPEARLTAGERELLRGWFVDASARVGR
jgi:hypothetical protein